MITTFALLSSHRILMLSPLPLLAEKCKYFSITLPRTQKAEKETKRIEVA